MPTSYCACLVVVACRARQACKAAAPGALAGGSPSGDAPFKLEAPPCGWGALNVAFNAAGIHAAHAVGPMCSRDTEMVAFKKGMHGASMHATLAHASQPLHTRCHLNVRQAFDKM